jgi:hypothetical protein
MARIDGTLEWLVDEDTNRVVGQKLPDGTEVGVVTSQTDPVTGGIGFNGVIVDMDETPDDTNTAALAVGTLIISPAE